MSQGLHCTSLQGQSWYKVHFTNQRSGKEETPALIQIIKQNKFYTQCANITNSNFTARFDREKQTLQSWTKISIAHYYTGINLEAGKRRDMRAYPSCPFAYAPPAIPKSRDDQLFLSFQARHWNHSFVSITILLLTRDVLHSVAPHEPFSVASKFSDLGLDSFWHSLLPALHE